MAGAMLGTRDQRLILGHFVTAGYEKPGGSSCKTLELRDRSVYRDSVYNAPVLAQLLPLPLRFREALRVVKGSATLCVWEAEPPDERFVALGMVATVSPGPASAQPPADAVRCVPLGWCTRAPENGLEEIWRDGLAGALWRVRQTGLLVAAKGAAPPVAYVLQPRLESEEPPPIADVGPNELRTSLFVM